MKHLQNISVLILGLGDSGLAMVRWCARSGASRIRVWDSRENPPRLQSLQQEVPAAHFFSGALTDAALEDACLVLKSPGLSPLNASVSPLLLAAQAAGVPIHGELDLFARALADLKEDKSYAPKVLAITGTNGKTTTTSLTAKLVERAGRTVGLAGNIGPTLLDTLSQALDLQGVADAEAQARAREEQAQEAAAAAVAAATEDAARVQSSGVSEVALEPADITAAGTAAPVADDDETVLTSEALAADAALTGEEVEAEALPPADDDEAAVVLAPPPPVEKVFEHLPQVWVLELSSFQLDGVQGFEPSAATVLNVTQDHLDWHGSMEAYAAAKARVFGTQAVMVINRDDTMVEAMVPAPAMVSSGRGKPKRAVGRRVCRFGLDAPGAPGDFGLVTENGMAWLVRAMPADETIKRRKDEEVDLIIQRLMPADALRIRGRHNASNALAALALATAIDCPLAPMLHGLREYRGEPHRVESIAIVGGIEAIDDSKGTNVGATVAALEGLGTDRHGKLLVILGGDGKGQDFSPLLTPVSRHARAVATIGRDAEPIEDAISASGVPMARLQSLEEAVVWCFEHAQPGDAVLLSPACASLDMFRNYAHRSEVFISAVQRWAEDHGEVIA